MRVFEGAANTSRGDGGDSVTSSGAGGTAGVTAVPTPTGVVKPTPPTAAAAATTNGPGTGLVGSVRYLSVAAHSGGRQTRRCDLESLAYVLIFLVRVSACRGRDGSLSRRSFAWPGGESNNSTVLADAYVGKG